MEGHTQFIPAQAGWLALFEEVHGDDVEIHAEPVVAWCLDTDEEGAEHRVVSFGRAVIGAAPWIDAGDSEKSARLFAVVREEQLDREMLEELAAKARHSKGELLERAVAHNEARRQGHASWVHERRTHRQERSRISPARIF